MRLVAGGRLRTVSVGTVLEAMCGPTDDPALPGDDDPLFAVPSLLLASLTTKEQQVLESHIKVLRRLMEPADDDLTMAERYERGWAGGHAAGSL